MEEDNYSRDLGAFLEPKGRLMSTFKHITVLLKEATEVLNLGHGDMAIDCTAGGGGHTALLLQAVGAGGKVWAIDRDPDACRTLRERFRTELDDRRLEIHEGTFAGFAASHPDLTGTISGICMDLGVSSFQIDTPSRGFSFLHPGPLDMRMNQKDHMQTAADLLRTSDVRTLTEIFREYGDEPNAHRFARSIVHRRDEQPFETTEDLASFIASISKYQKKSKRHPATRVFQALRIAVNDELNELQSFLDATLTMLRPGSRLAVITFHSLEDRLVKHAMKSWAEEKQKIPRGIPIISPQSSSRGKIIKPFPVMPSEAEIQENPRSRSAKLRVFEKRSDDA